MYSPFTATFKFIQYWLTASNGKGHGIHSPFVYALIREVLMDKQKYAGYEKPEAYRKQVEKDGTVLTVRDLGAGSVSGMTHSRTVSSIAKNSVKHKRYSSLLHRLACRYGYRHILEMGTSLGVTTMYLAGVPGVQEVVTMEGADAVADKAQAAFSSYGFNKVKLVRGEFSTNLEKVLREMECVDLVYIDGNHRKEPTVSYFHTIVPFLHNDSCIVFDDIHWSREMEQAWEEICADPRVSLAIDLHAVGLAFFRKEMLEKQHFVIRY